MNERRTVLVGLLIIFAALLVSACERATGPDCPLPDTLLTWDEFQLTQGCQTTIFVQVPPS